MSVSRPFHFEINTRYTDGERTGLRSSAGLTRAQGAELTALGAKLPAGTASYASAAARDKAVAKLVKALTQVSDTENLVINTYAENGMAGQTGGTARWTMLDGTELSITGQAI